MRGRVISTLTEFEGLTLDELGPRVRVDYTPDGVLAGEGSSEERSESDGEHGREWLRGLVEDLADDGLVEMTQRNGELVARLQE